MTSTSQRLMLVLAAGLCAASVVQAQTAVTAATSAGGKPLNIVVPYAGGGAADPVMRPLAQKLQERLGRPVLIDNRPGANGLIGTQHVIRAPADGNTILYHITSLIQNVALSRNRPTYDFTKDLEPMVLLGRQTVVLMVPANSPYKTFPDLAKAIKARPADFAYGSYGSGSTSHIYGEALRSALGVEMPHAAFRGTAALVQEMMAGRIPMAFVSATTSVERERDHTLRAIAVAGPKRMELLPNVPTLAELGYVGFEATGWWGLFMRPETPRAIADPLNAAIRATLQEPDMKARLRDAALEATNESPEQIAATMATDFKHWEALSRKFNISSD